MMYRFIYNLLIHLFSPLLLGLLYWPKQGKPGFGRRWPEHLGLVPTSRQENPVWLHAVSVGEMVAATPLIKAIKAEHPELPILVTTTTRTGADQAEKLGDLIEHRYAPLDFPWAISLFLRRVRPRALLIMETELWPNWLTACGRKQLPVMVLNARLSARSADKYKQFHGIFRLLSANISYIACQHRDDADRFADLGLCHEKLSVTGSIKFDIDYDDEVRRQGQALREQLGTRRPVWIAASTHEGEDEQLLTAHRELLQRLPQALLMLVPRHPQRFVQVAELVTRQGFTLSRRTLPASAAPTQVYLGDTMGELPVMLAAADVAFIGGSLIERGGHNLLEPAALGKPVLTGPSFFNFSDITHQLVDAGGARVVTNDNELAQQLAALLDSPAQGAQMGAQALNVVRANQGALLRTLSAIKAQLAL
ncbi:lipid IV(A) 3-deoxy-D-manno-octulosonic acid transferase [Oceanisphaera arctica]|uniref:3-deoxy-D-manno-octulosonic acid transferase n=1 Tax=Oceanisphaera arctica TaxID=641510 RepID=A0A2P5TKI1_9GAMM|nr:lipid IV(A) 3-deoxy-D-manno-octulosonic acid transferase [Oceanisphaera arctica]PPL15673.1 3-deoxy-D-manno-octulosonic acid transferase [Oceanisphaera arctica]GHA13586.1 3-deoxy-D-manno-octulosonic acid transferase [Oceanisphaera arctica]